MKAENAVNVRSEEVWCVIVTRNDWVEQCRVLNDYDCAATTADEFIQKFAGDAEWDRICALGILNYADGERWSNGDLSVGVVGPVEVERLVTIGKIG